MSVEMLNPVAHRYGGALFTLAEKDDSHSEVMADYKMVLLNLEESGELVYALNSPAVPLQVKKNILVKLFKGRINENLLKFLGLVVAKGRESDLGTIYRAYVKRVKDRQGIVVCKATFATEISEQAKEALRESVKSRVGQEVELGFEVNPDLIGGVMLQIGDKVIDLSVENQLLELKKRFVALRA